MAEHTPGPWITNGYTIEQDMPKGVLTSVVAHAEDENNADWQANARLLAAAPELLEACRALLAFNEELCADVGVSKHYPSAERARKAIAKATTTPEETIP